MPINLAAIFPILLPGLTSFCAVILPGILKNDRWPAWGNGVIAFLAVGVFAILTLLAGGKLTGDYRLDWFLLVAAFSSALAGPLRPLDSYLQSAVRIPGLHPPAPVTALMQSVYPNGRASKAVDPQPIVYKAQKPPAQGG